MPYWNIQVANFETRTERTEELHDLSGRPTSAGLLRSLRASYMQDVIIWMEQVHNLWKISPGVWQKTFLVELSDLLHCHTAPLQIIQAGME